MTETVDLPQTIHRAAALEIRADEAEGDTIAVSLSSEHPVARFGFTEVLGHGADEVDLAAFGARGLPVLRDHRNTVDSVVGRLVAPELRDGKLRGQLRFAEDEASQALRARVLRGELGELSVGYSIERLVRVSEDKDGGRVYRATRWTPRECSLVAVPADHTVGVGRGQGEQGTRAVPVINPQEKVMGDDTKAPETKGPTEAERKAAEAKRSDDVRAEAQRIAAEQVKADRERMVEIDRIGARFNMPRDMIERAQADGTTVAAFNGQILEHLGSDAGRAFTRANSIGLNDGERRQFSLVRLIHALAADSTDRNAREAARFELEACEAAADQAKGRTVKGALVPVDVLGARDFFTPEMQRAVRDLQVGDGSADTGGQMVATDLLAGSFIDLLRNNTILMGLGATVLDGLQGNVAIPKQTGGATAAWVGESDAPAESTQTIGQVELTPHTLAAFTQFSRKLTLQSSIAVEAFVRNDLTQTIAIALDLCGLNGSADADAPNGIADNGSILGTTLTTASSPTWAEVVEGFGKVAAANAARGSLGFALHPTMVAYLMSTPKVSGDATMIMPTDDRLAGFRAMWSPQVLTTDLWFANWADLVIGLWSGIDIVADPYSLSTSGRTRVTAFQDCDFGLRHPESFHRANGGS